MSNKKYDIKKQKNVYFVSKQKSLIDNCPYEQALQEIEAGGFFTSEIALQMLENGEVLMSKENYYAADFKQLEQWEIRPQVEEKPAEPVFGEGDFVESVDHAGRIGQIVTGEDSKTYVAFYDNGKSRKALFRVKKWAKVENQETALERFEATKPEPVIVAEPVEPLTEAERAEFVQIETELDELKDTFERKVPFEIGKRLSRIQEGRLHRETGKTFEAYVKERFGYSRDHASELARSARYLEAVQPQKLLGDGLSVRTTSALVRDTQALKTAIGLEDIGLTELTPVVTEVIEIVKKVMEASGSKNPSLVIQKVGETVRDIVGTDTVEIDGKAVKIEDAKAQNIFTEAAQTQILENVKETLNAQKDAIAQKAKEAFERQNQPVFDGGNTPSSSSSSTPKEVYSGKVSKLKTSCSNHGVQEVKNIGNGKMQLMCLCRFHVDSVTNTITCFEIDGKRVKN